MTFEQALAVLGKGRFIARSAWHGDFVSPGNCCLCGCRNRGPSYVRKIDGQNLAINFGVWSPTPEDIAAKDWDIVRPIRSDWDMDLIQQLTGKRRRLRVRTKKAKGA